MAKGVAAWPEKLPVKNLRSRGDHHRDTVAAAAEQRVDAQTTQGRFWFLRMTEKK
jgi:hypothetical protein